MTTRSSRGLILLAVVLVSLSMRGAITAVPPIIDELTIDLGITRAAAGLLTSLPVLFFALAAPLAAVLGRRLGPGHAVLVGLVLILVGTLGRVLGEAALLFLGTAVIGLGITIANILVPVVIKRDFAHHASRVTGYFVAAMAIGATLHAALSVPLSDWLGWRGGLAFWAFLVPFAALGWWLHVTRSERAGRASPAGAAPVAPQPRPGDGYVWRIPLAWALALAFGAQSSLFYSMTTWLPSLLVDRAGVSGGTAGLALSIYQITAIPTALTVAALCRLRPSQGWLGVLLAGGWLVAILGFLLAPGLWLVWSVVGGLAQGGGFTFILTLIVLRGSDENAVRALGAMGQLVGYLIAASGPFIVGWLAETTGGWTAPGAYLIGLAVVLALASLVAGRDETIDAPAH